MNEIMFNPGRGIEAMQAAKAEAEAAKTNRPKTSYFGLKDGEKGIIRIITPIDKMPHVLYHNYVPTKPAPGSTTPSAPMSAACRVQRAFTRPDGSKVFPDCWICDAKVTNSRGQIIKPTWKMVAVACLREWNGERFIDTPREVEMTLEDGTKTTVPQRALVIVAQAPSNFWELILPMSSRTGTLSDRDFEITRSGQGKDTKYVPMPFDTDPLLNPKTEAWNSYLEAAKAQGLDPDKFVIGQASDEYYARFFDPRFTVNDQGKVVPTGTSAPAPTAAAKTAAQSDFDRQIAELQQSTAPAPSAVPSPTPAPAAPYDPWASGTGDAAYAPAF